MVALLLLSLVLSLDALGAGFTYGLKQIRFPFGSLLAFGCAAISTAFLAVLAGNLLGMLLPSWTGNLLSGLLLLLLGGKMLLSSLREQQGIEQERASRSMAVHLLGLTVTVVVNPSKGDLNHSNVIDLGEAILLGIALSLDTFGAGISFGIQGDLWGFPLVVGLFHLLLMPVGKWLGTICRMQWKRADKMLSFLPGILLILFGIYHLFRL